MRLNEKTFRDLGSGFMKELQKKFDLEGINSPKRGSFKTGFGGNIYPYYNIKFIY